jgi:hypothetical protein
MLLSATDSTSETPERASTADELARPIARAAPPVSPPDVDQPGDRIGVYRLVSEVGRNSTGSVWLAERVDGHFEREVALKLLHPPAGHASSTTPLAWAQRMAAERKLAVRLEHPHIARVFDAGVDSRGRPFLVTARALGNDLIQHAQRRRLKASARLALMLQVCAAVIHVHGMQWAHGRLKPSNLRIDGNGRVQLLDAGISRILAGWRPREGSAEIREGRAGGPDGGAGIGPAPSVAQDVHALGLLLRELMADAPCATCLRRDLDAVVSRAIAQNPMWRYGTAQDMAADVQRLLDQRPVSAAPAPLGHRLHLGFRRHRLSMAIGAGVLLVLTAVVSLSWREHRQTQALAERDQQARNFLEEAYALPMRDARHWQAAVVRARQGFEGQPALRGQVLARLGVGGRDIGQAEGALQVLAEAHALLQRVARADDPARLGAGAELARQWLINGAPDDVGPATALADDALARCREESARCASVRASAHGALSLLAKARGDSDLQRQEVQRQALEEALQARLERGGP